MLERQVGSVIVTGIPGAGKTTIAREIAARARFGAHLGIDVIYGLIADPIMFRRDSPPEDWWQLELARRHVVVLAKSFEQHGVLSVVDDVVADGGVWERYLRELPAPLRVIVLAPSAEVVLRRDAERDKQVAAQWTYLAEPMRAVLGRIGLWLDTSELDVAATLAAIEERWDEAVIERPADVNGASG